jgi:hypothetical protein
MIVERRRVGRQVGREAAFVADRRVISLAPSARPSARGTPRHPMRRPSRKLLAPTGMTMNSWKSTLLSACAPPLRMFIIGTGR